MDEIKLQSQSGRCCICHGRQRGSPTIALGSSVVCVWAKQFCSCCKGHNINWRIQSSRQQTQKHSPV